MPRKKTQYPVGKNPNSLENLIHEGRPRSEEVYGQDKKQRTLTVTDAGWEGAKKAIKAAGYSSVSDYLEQIGRGQDVLTA